jgi:disulfide oxidoreductase YuzD
VVLYHDVSGADTAASFVGVTEEIEQRGLLYPVTAVDGVLVYDGAVSYPAIMRAVHNKLLEREQSEA